jgi:hypothetical protein
LSESLIARSPDLKRLVDAGYHIAIRSSGHLLVHDVPYVDGSGETRRGTLVTTLETAGDLTVRPSDHTVWFIGAFPCDATGQPIEGLRNSDQQVIDDDLVADYRFSSKRADGEPYADYFEKIVTYVAVLEGPAQELDPQLTAQTSPVVPSNEEDEVFEYYDSASSRARIVRASRKLELGAVAIVGLGGSGAYVLDLVAKTRVREIHLFDDDVFLTHNAFRGPGAVSIDDLRAQPSKVHYWASRYRPLRRGIVEHPYRIDADNVTDLDSMDFVFLCMDAGSTKADVIAGLERAGRSFVDTGMGLGLVDDAISGIVRTTSSYPNRRDTFRAAVPIANPDKDNDYARNIQIAELNALNAVFAVVRWKKTFGFYHDYEHELSCTYTIDTNVLTSDDED